MVKLSVGTESADGLEEWQVTRGAQYADGLPRHVTRMWPKRAAEILDGGSMYWVIRGVIRCRQRILRFDEEIGSDGIRRCAIVLDPTLHRTDAAPRRPFQGWRYLEPAAAPRDIRAGRIAGDALPDTLESALAEIGVR